MCLELGSTEYCLIPYTLSDLYSYSLGRSVYVREGYSYSLGRRSMMNFIDVFRWHVLKFCADYGCFHPQLGQAPFLAHTYICLCLIDVMIRQLSIFVFIPLIVIYCFLVEH